MRFFEELFFVCNISICLLFLIYLIRYNKLRASFQTLADRFNELDEQAKLIVRTDLELNKAQEELDKRLSGLDALQETSRLISTTLDENEIFKCINDAALTELGFEKYLILTLAEDDHLMPRVNFGYSQAEAEAIATYTKQDPDMLTLFKERKLFSSVRSSETLIESVLKIFNVKHFVLAPIHSQVTLAGILFAGNQSDAYTLTEGDEELISILADQVGQALENARLFEQVYKSSQNLENKVQDRTKQLSSALEEVQKISKMKSEFISAVSHELRTPLTSIKGYASILIKGKVGAIPDQVKDRLEKINKHSDNLVKLINDLLDISRIESGRTEMNFVENSLGPIIENVQDLLMPQMKEKEIQFESKIPKPLPEILMDTSQVERIFINLIGNAIKFTPQKGIIKVIIEHDIEKITVSVSDNGIGIKKEDMGKLFTEFYRVENEINLNVKGSGLGLALARKIVEAHGGEMWVTSKVHEGTTFLFTLPFGKKSTIKGEL